MSKSFKMQVNTFNTFKACYNYFESNSEYNKTAERYAKSINVEQDIIDKIDAERDELIKKDVPWSKVREHRVEERVIAKRNIEELEEAQSSALKPYAQERARAQRAIASISGLYNAYRVSMEKGSWEATGYVLDKTKKGVKRTEVPVCFNKLLVELLTNEGCKFNKKSAEHCSSVFMTRIGCKPTKNCELAVYSRRDFVRLVVACAMDYAEKHMSVEECCKIMEG